MRLRALPALAALTLLTLVSAPLAFAQPQQSDNAPRQAMFSVLARKLFGAEGREKAGPLRPAGDWRLLEGRGLIGVMRLSSDAGAKAGRYGFFAFRLEGSGVYEGIFNVKPGGQAMHGVFWPDGKANTGPVAGTLDLVADAAGRGVGAAEFAGGRGKATLTAR